MPEIIRKQFQYSFFSLGVTNGTADGICVSSAGSPIEEHQYPYTVSGCMDYCLNNPSCTMIAYGDYSSSASLYRCKLYGGTFIEADKGHWSTSGSVDGYYWLKKNFKCYYMEAGKIDLSAFNI